MLPARTHCVPATPASTLFSTRAELTPTCTEGPWGESPHLSAQPPSYGLRILQSKLRNLHPITVLNNLVSLFTSLLPASLHYL